MTVLHGTATTLRPIRRDDADILAEILAEPEVSRWWPRYDPERVKRELVEGEGTTVLVIEADGQVVGSVQYVEESAPDYRHASMDVFIHPDWHGKGIGTDAVRTVARHLIHDRGHHRLAIDPATNNERAIRTFKRVGFQPVGVMRQYERNAEGEWQDCLLMDLLEKDLQ